MNETLVLDKAAQDLLFRDARTANTFTGEPVTEEQVRVIYDLVKYGPTSMNNQPLRVTVLRSPESRERLIPHMAGGNAEKTSAAPLTLILSADTDFHDRLSETFPIFPGARDTYADDLDARTATATLNTSLQVAYLIIGVRAAGLAAGPMTGFDAEGVRKEFFGEDSPLRPLVVMNVGRPGPDAWFDRLPRLSHEDVITEL